MLEDEILVDGAIFIYINFEGKIYYNLKEVFISTESNKYLYPGARAMVHLHEQHLRSFVKTWRKAKELNIRLPETRDKDYESLETLLRHILLAARGYMTWMCKKLDLPDPEINPTPEAEEITAVADTYLEHLVKKWKHPLAIVSKEKFEDKLYTARWGIDYCIDAMMEHAVMHPIRHEYQLKNLIEKQSGVND